MIIQSIWLTKLILAHLVTDFILQPTTWVEDRNEKHFRSAKLYLHGLITGVFALMMIGWQYRVVVLIILITHILIDAWKSYRAKTTAYFLIDQGMHLLVIAGCWYFLFINWTDVKNAYHQLDSQIAIWKTITAFVFLTAPAGILIGQLTKKWRDKIPDADSLEDAGKWIGIIERIIILVFVLYHQYSAIGLLVAAKGIIRFSEKDRPEVKTEYLVIGTLMSIGLAVLTGLAIQL